MANIGEKLRILMEKKELTCYELAIRAGVKDMTIWGWIKGKTMPNIKQLEKVCEVLYITLAEFLAEKEVVELTDDLRPFVQRWSLLSKDQQESIVSVMDNFIKCQ